MWVGDAPRCRAAGVPEEEIHVRTKPELALEMIAAARSRGHLAGEWVMADSVYGNSPTFRSGVEALGLQYVLEVQSNVRVFEHEVETVLPAYSGRGGRRPQSSALLQALPLHVRYTRLAAHFLPRHGMS